MRTLLVLSVSALLLKPCAKSDDDAPVDGAATSTTASAKASAEGPITNEKNITRYPTERKVDEQATTARESDLRSSPPTGSIVTHVAMGTAVHKIATMPGAALVVVTAASGERTMGWLVDQAFEAEPTPPVPVPVFVNRDAGAATLKDAGITPPAVVDAGAPKAATPSKKAVGGKCDPGWVVFPTGSDTCRKTCSADADCGNPGLKCLPKGSQKFCTGA